MHLNMKNFLELTDINTSEQLEVSLTLVKHGDIKFLAKINDVCVDADHTTLKFDLFDSIKLEFTVLEFVPGSSGVDITAFAINGLDVLPKYKHLFKTDTYLDKLGTVEFVIPGPFYTWYHTVSGQGLIA